MDVSSSGLLRIWEQVPKEPGLTMDNWPYGQFETKTGPVFLVIQSDREWQRFCANVLGVSSIADDKRFNTNPKENGEI